MNLQIIGTDAVLKIFVPVCPCSCVIFPHPAMYPLLPTISNNGADGMQIGKMCALKVNSFINVIREKSKNKLTCSQLAFEASKLQRQIDPVGLI